MDAIILCGGESIRLHGVEKTALNINGRNPIRSAVGRALNAGVDGEIVFCLSSAHKKTEKIICDIVDEQKEHREYLDVNPEFRILYEESPPGIIKSLFNALECLYSENIMIMLGDEIYPFSLDVKLATDAFIALDLDLLVFAEETYDYTKIMETYRIFYHYPFKTISGFCEKPTEEIAVDADFCRPERGTGMWLIKRNYLTLAPHRIIHNNIPELLNEVILEGATAMTFAFGGPYFNLNTEKDVKEALDWSRPTTLL